MKVDSTTVAVLCDKSNATLRHALFYLECFEVFRLATTGSLAATNTFSCLMLIESECPELVQMGNLTMCMCGVEELALVKERFENPGHTAPTSSVPSSQDLLLGIGSSEFCHRFVTFFGSEGAHKSSSWVPKMLKRIERLPHGNALWVRLDTERFYSSQLSIMWKAYNRERDHRS